MKAAYYLAKYVAVLKEMNDKWNAIISLYEKIQLWYWRS